jgi:hypothetical protein
MKVFTEESVKLIASRNGWSQTFAKGFVEGNSSRRRGAKPSTYAQIGIDEYSLGFRTGYYERGVGGVAPSSPPAAPIAGLLAIAPRKKSGDNSL